MMLCWRNTLQSCPLELVHEMSHWRHTPTQLPKGLPGNTGDSSLFWALCTVGASLEKLCVLLEPVVWAIRTRKQNTFPPAMSLWYSLPKSLQCQWTKEIYLTGPDSSSQKSQRGWVCIWEVINRERQRPNFLLLLLFNHFQKKTLKKFVWLWSGKAFLDSTQKAQIIKEKNWSIRPHWKWFLKDSIKKIKDKL